LKLVELKVVKLADERVATKAWKKGEMMDALSAAMTDLRTVEMKAGMWVEQQDDLMALQKADHLAAL